MKSKNITIKQSSLNDRLPYDESEFDLVSALCVIPHIQKPINLFNVVKRVLKPGGIFYFEIPNAVYLKNRIKVLVGKNIHHDLERYYSECFRGHWREFVKSEMQILQNQYEFSPLKISYINSLMEHDPSFNKLFAKLFNLISYFIPSLKDSIRVAFLNNK